MCCAVIITLMLLFLSFAAKVKDPSGMTTIFSMRFAIDKPGVMVCQHTTCCGTGYGYEKVKTLTVPYYCWTHFSGVLGVPEIRFVNRFFFFLNLYCLTTLISVNQFEELQLWSMGF